MSQVSAAVTDLISAGVLAGTAVLVRRDVSRWWPAAFAAAAAGSAVGAVHHLAFPPATTGDSGSADSFAVAGVALSVALACLLSGSATLTSAPVRRTWTTLAWICAALFGLAALTGRGTVGPLVLSQLPTMLAIVGLWCALAVRNRPGARAVVAAFVLTAASAIAFVGPGKAVSSLVDIDPVTLQHLLQLPGMVLIARAVRAAAVRREPLPARSAALDQ